jgi:hypothetical protein
VNWAQSCFHHLVLVVAIFQQIFAQLTQRCSRE